MALLDMDVILEKNTVKEMVDEMFNQFYTVRYTKHEDWKGTAKTIYGHYMRTRRSVRDGNEHAFDLLAHTCEKYTREFYDNDRDRMNIEDFLQDSRLDLYEILLKLGNGKIKLFEINSVYDFKSLLLDKEKSMQARSYILKSLKSNMYKRNMGEGKLNPASSNTYGIRVQKNGVRKIVWEKLKWMDIDKKVECKDDDVENTVLEMHLLKNSMLNNDIDNLFIENGSNSIYKYILENKDNIFVKKQLDYLEFLLAGGDKRKYRENYKFSYNTTERNIVKKAIEKLGDNKYFYIVNGQLKQKQIDFLETVESIINADSTLEQFFLIQSVVCDDNTILNKMFIDLIYSLDERIIRDLVFCLTDTVDEKWLETEGFRKIIEVLVNEYNYQIKNAKLIYKYNVQQQVTKEEKLINYIENKVFFIKDEDFGYVAKSNNDKGIVTIDNIKEFINKTFKTDIDKRDVKFVLEKYGYDLDTHRKTTKNKVGAYKVLRKHS